jgi:hypothetical protein
VAGALRPRPCQKCHLTGGFVWLINGVGKCGEGPVSVSLHVRFRPTHAPAPVAQHPVWPGPASLTAPYLSARFEWTRKMETAAVAFVFTLSVAFLPGALYWPSPRDALAGL